MEIAKAENSAKPIIGTQAFVVGVAGSPQILRKPHPPVDAKSPLKSANIKSKSGLSRSKQSKSIAPGSSLEQN